MEAWTSESALRAVMDLDPDLAQFPASQAEIDAALATHLQVFTAWEVAHLPADPGNTGESNGWHAASFDDRDWPEMRLPTMWQSRGLQHNGTVWFRRRVTIPQAWVGRELTLSLGMLDDYDTTYVNGQRVGEHPKGTPAAYQVHRTYPVPAAVVRGTELVVAVRIFDHFGQGGFAGPAAEMALAPADGTGEPVALDEPWRYRVEHVIPIVSADVFRTAPPMPWQVQVHNRASALFNAMIHPLVGFGLRGVIWYQGEANVDKWDVYRARFTAMIRDWRTRWGQGQFPFLFVQLANWSGGPAWPYLQEAQAQTLSEPSTGMALAVDIGDPGDIHPRNKREVGRRLALIARRQVYRQDAQDCGPTLRSADIRDNAATVHFNCTGALKTSDGEPPREFELVGRDGRFHAAQVQISGDTAFLTSPQVPAPVAVRYAFRDTPICNLTDGSELPAVPFRTDGW